MFKGTFGDPYIIIPTLSCKHIHLGTLLIIPHFLPSPLYILCPLLFYPELWEADSCRLYLLMHSEFFPDPWLEIRRPDIFSPGSFSVILLLIVVIPYMVTANSLLSLAY